MKQRYFNYRPLLFIFMSLVAGSLFSYFIFEKPIMTIVITTILFGLLLFTSIVKKKAKYILIPVLAFLIGIGSYYLAIYNFNKGTDVIPSEVTLKVVSVETAEDHEMRIIGDDVKFDGKNINCKVYVNLKDSTGLFNGVVIGERIRFAPTSTFRINLFYYDAPNSTLYKNNIKYFTSAKVSNIEFLGEDKDVLETIRERINDNLHLGLTNENADFTYSALFGDKSSLSEKQYNFYRTSGLAHLLAVSGLHIGLIVLVFNWIFKKLKVNKYVRLIILFGFLLFYLMLCDFAYSALRACIMAIILLIADILHENYDSLNAISIAGILIFITNPFCIFDVSFLLSFACAFGITILHKPIKIFLISIKFNEKLADAVALSLSATISIMIVLAFYFQTLNIISVLANILLIPLFTIGFEIVFIVSLLSLICPYICYLLVPINYLFNFVSLGCVFFSASSLSHINTINFNYFGIIAYFALILVLGRFCTAKWQYKIIISLPLVALLVACLV